jgi:hypothetical protein
VRASPAPSRPVAAPQTPAPAKTPKPAKSTGSAKGTDINARLRALIPNGPVNAQTKTYKSDLGKLTAPPTPPPEVLARTKYIYEENVGALKWKESILGTAPEERYVKMYVTSVKRVGPVTFCTGWVERQPVGGNVEWIVENATFLCGRSLTPYVPSPSPQPPGTP